MADTRAQPPAEREDHEAKKVTLDLPMMSIQLHKPAMPHIRLPHLGKQEMGHAVDTARSVLPPPERVAYYGALGALAVFGVVEWPVAAAIGVGTVIAQRARGNGANKQDKAREAEKQKREKAAGKQEPGQKRETASKAAAAASSKRKAASVRDAMNRQKSAAERARASG